MKEPALLTDVQLDKQLSGVSKQIKDLLTQFGTIGQTPTKPGKLNTRTVPYLIDLETLQQKLVDEKFKRSNG